MSTKTMSYTLPPVPRGTFARLVRETLEARRAHPTDERHLVLTDD
jgi:hypothetical protein